MTARLIISALALLSPLLARAEDAPREISGVYPHLRMWNDHGEAGTGAVVPWQGELWAITYAPHFPDGSTDRLYRITPDLEQEIFEGSIGGTPANRMIHRESGQLLIGPYLVDKEKSIRVIPPSKMFGRLTGTARHLEDPANKVYYATMEEGLYEVDVHSLEVRCLIRDGNRGAPEIGIVSELPGYHGKGLFSGQGRLVYANNGDRGPRVKVDPTVPSGALAQWFGEGDWRLVRRNQFTEVTGPGGLSGNERESDPIWTMGWDAKSLLLGLLDGGEWTFHRLPKGSHSYDGAHGWNTEWPRIREIGEEDLLATMHGTFWRFPADFSRENTGGIAPRSNYLKVIGDFCRWDDRVVFGCDDSARAEFLNTRPFKAEHGAPLQSNSNLWFVEPERIDRLGPPIGRGSVWLREDVVADAPSDPYLFSGYDLRFLHLVHGTEETVPFRLEIDREGSGEWTTLREIRVDPGKPAFLPFSPEESGAWIRVVALADAAGVSAHFHFRDRDARDETNHHRFDGNARVGVEPKTTGLMRSLSHDRLGLVVPGPDGGLEGDEVPAAYYEITTGLEIVPRKDAGSQRLVLQARQPAGTVLEDEASVILVEDGKRYRLPRHPDWPEKPEAVEIPEEKTLAHHLPDHLARGARVRVGSTHEDYVAGHATDGALEDDSRWIGSGEGNGWIELEFDSPRTIGSIWVVTGWKGDAAYTAKNFDVHYAEEDGWKPLPGGKVRGNSRIEREIRLEIPVTTTGLRIESPDDGYFRVYEIAAFADSPDITTPVVAGIGPARICREVATERDLLNVHGSFYELPARNAQGLAKVRPIATHDLAIRDFCSHNGLLFLTGLDASTESRHILRSEDGRAAVWAGVVDDLWQLGKPRGEGGPWKSTEVKAGQASDPYLMTGYDRKSYRIESSEAASIRLEVDIDGTGLWVPWKTFALEGGGSVEGDFPDAFGAYWIRAVSDADTTATVWLTYR